VATRPQQKTGDRRWRWRGSLAFRLSVTINLTAVLVLGAFWVYDYRRERDIHLRNAVARLYEEAGVLRAARTYLRDPERFQDYVNTFCEQMNVAASPGHHIVVFGPDGRIMSRAHVRPDPTLETHMATGRDEPVHWFTYRDQPFLSVSIDDSGPGRIVVAQSLVPVQELIRAQALSRAASLAVLALLIFGVTTLVLLAWVWSPLRRLARQVERVGRGDFSTRFESAGSNELDLLARGFNEMTVALERVEHSRQFEMRRARDIQRRLLPPMPVVTDAYEVVAAFEPAQSVGGDLFDVVRLSDGSLVVAVLDVSGHGVPGALYTALLRTVIRQQAASGADLRDVLRAMSEEFLGVAAESGEFVTCFLARLDAHDGHVTYSGAGHEPGLLVRCDGRVEALESGGLPIGLVTQREDRVHDTRLDPGDRLFVYTDGLHEVRGDRTELFGRQRLTEVLVRTRNMCPQEQVIAVTEAVREFTGGRAFDDDVTLVCVSRRASDSA